jgi:tRNA(Arg) A34 adenosine deaminase TadA
MTRRHWKREVTREPVSFCAHAALWCGLEKLTLAAALSATSWVSRGCCGVLYGCAEPRIMRGCRRDVIGCNRGEDEVVRGRGDTGEEGVEVERSEVGGGYE